MYSKPLARLVLAMALLAVFAVAARARAADEPPSTPEVTTMPEAPEATPSRPWAEMVSESAQQQALALFEEGNTLFETSQHAAALAKYKEALTFWDHPAIRYNAAVALINLDQPLVANEYLELALRYGALPFSADTYQQALTYRKLLQGQLAELKVSCAEPNAEVTLDGAPLFVGPGNASRWLLPGPHQLVARKTGFMTETRSLTLLPGKPATERIALKEIRVRPTKTVRRWPVWQPWAVVGAGALVGLGGVPFLLDAQSNFDEFDAQVTQACPKGCPASEIPQTAFDARVRGRAENIVALSLFGVGGAAVAAGVVLVVLNQPKVVPAEQGSRLSAAPIVGWNVAGFSIALQH